MRERKREKEKVRKMKSNLLKEHLPYIISSEWLLSGSMSSMAGGSVVERKKKNFDVEERIDGFIYLLTFQRELWRPTHGNDQMDLSLLGYFEIEMTR